MCGTAVDFFVLLTVCDTAALMLKLPTLKLAFRMEMTVEFTAVHNYITLSPGRERKSTEFLYVRTHVYMHVHKRKRERKSERSSVKDKDRGKDSLGKSTDSLIFLNDTFAAIHLQ